MFCRTNQWEAPKFPRELFHDSNSTGGRVLMHTKACQCKYTYEFLTHSRSSDDYRDLPPQEIDI